MVNIIIIAVIICIAAAAVCYLVRAKKRGETCVGCPYAKQCARQHSGQCGGNSCGHTEKKK